MTTSLLKRLLERRVLQYLALYVGVGWGFLQFMVFLQDTFMLSPEWTKLALVALTLLIPSVLIFSYFHGRPGRDRWMRFELIGIPLNVAVALIVLFIEFGGKDLGAQVERVTVRDESGQEVERKVPKSEHRKRVGVFYFDGMDGDTSKWLQYGVPTAVLTDLSQDMFVDLRFGPFFRDKLRQTGHVDELTVPMPLKREIARDLHLGYVVSGTVKQDGGRYTAKASLHDAVSAKLIGEWTFTEATPQELADRISLEIRKGMGIPSKHIEESADLPVSETLTPSVEAFRHYSDAQHMMEVSDDYFAGAGALERAVQTDPTFAIAHYSLYAAYIVTNQGAKAMPELQSTMQHLYRMPERVQNMVKFEHYFMTQQQEKAYAVAQLNSELYPDDLRSLQLLTQVQVLRDDKDGAITSLRRTLELDPQQAESLQQIGDLYRAKGVLDTALTYYSQYAERFPQKQESFMRLGDVRVQSGRHAEAKRDYEKALLIDPGAVPAMLRLADIDRELGNHDAALRGYEQALAAARTAEHRGQALSSLKALYEVRGQYRRALEYRQKAAAELAKVQPPFMMAVEELTELGLYVRAGQANTAEQRLALFRRELTAPMNIYVPLGELDLALERKQYDRAAKAAAEAEQRTAAMGMRVLQVFILQGKGELHRRKGEWQQALAAYEQLAKAAPSKVTIQADMAECYRELGQLDRALAAVQKVLRVHPANPRANLEAGLIELRRGRRAEAQKYLQRAVDIWKDADPDYERAAQARAALAGLGAPTRT